MRHARTARVRLAIVAAVLATLAGIRADAQAPRSAGKNFLWKVQSGARVLYLAGSVHALSKDVYPLNPVFQRAFDGAGTLVEEIDLGEASQVAAAPVIMSKGLYQDGRTFDQVLSRETVTMVDARARQMGLPIDMMRRMKPWMVMLTLTALQVGQAGLDPSLGLDKHFFDQAGAAGKMVVGLETLPFQIDRFDSMSDLTQEQLLRSTLNEMDAEPTALKDIVRAWQVGDASYFEKTVLSEFKDYPAAYTSLIVERNRAWIPQLESCLSRPAPCFVVVGAAHLVGPDGLLELLRRKGYRVEQQ